MAPRADLADLLAPGCRVIVTGQIGCGKTTLAAGLAERFHLLHLRLDEFNGRDDARAGAAAAVESIEEGWVVDGCVWQVPDTAWRCADVAVHLDYSNAVHYRRILRRAARRSVSTHSLRRAREVFAEEWGHFEIMRKHADANRRGWSDAGGISPASTPVVRLDHPRDARALLAGTRQDQTTL